MWCCTTMWAAMHWGWGEGRSLNAYKSHRTLSLALNDIIDKECISLALPPAGVVSLRTGLGGGGCVHLVFLPSGLAHITSISSMRRHRRPIRVTSINTVSSAHHMAKHEAGNSRKTLTLATVLKKATVRLRDRIRDKRTVPDRLRWMSHAAETENLQKTLQSCKQ